LVEDLLYLRGRKLPLIGRYTAGALLIGNAPRLLDQLIHKL